MPLTKIVNGRTVEMSAEEEAAFVADQAAIAEARANAVPAKVTRLQMRRALRQFGYLARFTAVAAQASDDVRDMLDLAAEFDRADPFWNALGAALTPPRSPADIDALFRLAATK